MTCAACRQDHLFAARQLTGLPLPCRPLSRRHCSTVLLYGYSFEIQLESHSPSIRPLAVGFVLPHPTTLLVSEITRRIEQTNLGLGRRPRLTT